MGKIKREDFNKQKFYICSPWKNVGCSGRFKPHCDIRCFCTTKPHCAIDSEHPLTYEQYYREAGERALSFDNMFRTGKEKRDGNNRGGKDT